MTTGSPVCTFGDVSKYQHHSYTGVYEIEVYEIRRLASGSFATVDEGRVLNITHEAPFGTCDWTVQGPPLDRPDDWYADSPTDLIRDCGAPVVTPDGPALCDGHLGLLGLSDPDFEAVIATRPETTAWIA